MATIYLAGDDTITVFNPARVYGATGRETVLISPDARGVHLSPAVERADLAGRAADYQFRGASGQVEIWQDGGLVASIPATGSGGTEARFADGAADIAADPATGAVTLGGRVLGPTAESVDIPLDPDRPSDPAVNPAPEVETLTIDAAQDDGNGGRTITGAAGRNTTFDLAGASGDDLADLAIIDPDGPGDDDTLKIRADQKPAKVENVESIEVVGDADNHEFSAGHCTGLRKISVSSSEDDGSFVIADAGSAREIVAGDEISELFITARGDVTLRGDESTTVWLSFAEGAGDAVVDASAMAGFTFVNGDNVSGDLTVTGGSGNVQVEIDSSFTGVLTFDAGKGDASSFLVARQDVTLADGSKISNVDYMVVLGGTFELADTMLDQKPGFALGGALKISQTKNALDLSSITEHTEYDEEGILVPATIEVTGLDGGCGITLGSGNGIAETVIVRSAVNAGADAVAGTVISGFAAEEDMIGFEGARGTQFVDDMDGVDSLPDLLAKAEREFSLENTVYFGAFGSGGSFAIMRASADTFLVAELTGVALVEEDAGIFI